MMVPESWSITERGFDSKRLAHFEGLFTLGSGLLHVRGSLAEPLESAPQDVEYLRLPTNVTAERHPDFVSRWGTYLPMVVGRHPLLNTVVVNLPWPLQAMFVVGGASLSVESEFLEQHMRYLDMARATLVRRSAWHLPSSGARVHLVEERFVSRHRPNLIVQRFELRSDQDTDAELVSGIDGRVRTNGHDHFSVCEASADPDGSIAVRIETDLGARAQVCSRLGREGDTGDLLPLDASAEVHDRFVESRAGFRLGSGETWVGVKLSWLGEGDGAAELRQAAAAGYQVLRGEHETAWRILWDKAALVTEDRARVGDAQLSLALRFSVYHLLRAHRTGETGFAICPKGHAGEAYFGRYFWDTEVYLLPFYLYTDPEHARDLLRFRIRTLDGARRNARRYGAVGARFAWESSVFGDEECPNWQYADHEIHVTADVVYGILHYVAATGDTGFLDHEAGELVIEAARYYLARIDKLPDGSMHLFGVMGPDEYTPLGIDNSYTNRLVKLVLDTAADLLRRRGEGGEEVAAFRHAAGSLPLPRDTERNILLQSSDFAALPELDRSGLDPRRPVAAQVTQEQLYRRKALKQADVVALIALFPHEFDRGEVARTIDYYEPLTTHDSSLSPTTHALVAARIGRSEDAWNFLSRSVDIDVGSTRGDASQGVHIANAAGNWQVAVFGFLGLLPAISTSVPAVEPHLPEGLGSIEASIVWHGTRIRLYADHMSLSATHLSGPATDIVLAGRRSRLTEGGRVEVPLA